MKKQFKPYETDASQIEGTATEVLQPETIEKLIDYVKKNQSLTIRAGGTGLAAGAVPTNNPILDTSKLDKIIEFNKDKKTIIVETGIILDELQDYLNRYNLEFPINPSSHAVCTIGGMIAANAVGSRAARYGKITDWVLWMDIVNEEGKIDRKNKPDFKDYIGMEGTTGVIVKTCLKLTGKKNRVMRIIEFEDIDEMINKIKELKKEESISAIELSGKQVSKLIGLENKYCLFVEYETEKEKSSKAIQEKRDSIYPKLANEGFIRIEDPKLMLEKIPRLIEWLEEKEIPYYGHISVGILHPCFPKEKEEYIPEMMNLVKKLGGQISGEHGIGLIKKQFVEETDKKIIRSIKHRLDPQNKFNPGKIIDG
jgi:glycolate oxidase